LSPSISAIVRTRLAHTDIDAAPIAGPCFILGSAPGAAGLPGSGGPWTLITVNASQVIAEAWGVSTPDITVMSDQMLGTSPANLAAKEALQGRGCGTLVLITRKYTLDDSIQRLRDIGYGWKRLAPIDHWQRSKIVWRVTGEYLAAGSGGEKVSTGFFAIFLARHLGGAPIVADGFSLSKHGHGYNQFAHHREHIETDTSALAAMHRLSGIYACGPDFAEESGLPAYGSAGR